MEIELTINTWWKRRCNGKRYFLRQINSSDGKVDKFSRVWIYEEGVNRCLHIKATTLLKCYDRIVTGPADPKTGNVTPATN